jgi:hypothetical protein
MRKQFTRHGTFPSRADKEQAWETELGSPDVLEDVLPFDNQHRAHDAGDPSHSAASKVSATTAAALQGAAVGRPVLSTRKTLEYLATL